MDDLFGPDDLLGLDVVDEDEFLAADECPRCGHDADDHDENGCGKCGCLGPEA